MIGIWLRLSKRSADSWHQSAESVDEGEEMQLQQRCHAVSVSYTISIGAWIHSTIVEIEATIVRPMVVDSDDDGWRGRETRKRRGRRDGRERHLISDLGKILWWGNRWKWPFLSYFSWEAIHYEKRAQSARNSWQIKHNLKLRAKYEHFTRGEMSGKGNHGHLMPVFTKQCDLELAVQILRELRSSPPFSCVRSTLSCNWGHKVPAVFKGYSIGSYVQLSHLQLTFS